ncbi:MAG: TraB/GumN family protein [Candidatus Altiarchaeum hamiconexum]|uniref:TraB/GumN family protein n=2 Tax=Candidatus Altarchaeum hamiconexum TaxID=1803513 RepID=A0A8J8CK74_9ARCH|nr:TraB/GumN family protein [Candidatus Altarchaeum hamiconexum]NCS91112.1 TraB/GumN family protein [Candidatus Altarchaeum hamiconexum]NCT00941.1 TraB/GumN family protein [Candidatus Altarchaeum hamiconexum]OIQ05318.1 MAG: hypothetical protein AUK59_04310 [Candidatus Altarchaeum sp. CG2_30_32_3053]PIX49421.1 MAG: TraB family protein [Candidatus Altarchaeum sp. CG_4_8_14_3_um_filter_33_2054]
MIERLIKNNKKITLIGTAHISKESVHEVKSTIEAEKPDVVCVELCPRRYEILNNKEKWKQTDITKIIKEGKIYLFLVNLILSNFQKRLGEDVGILPGAEMIEATNVARNLNIPIELADRDINITMKRASSKMGVFEKYKIFSLILMSLFFSEKLRAEEIEQLKNKDVMSQMMDELSLAFPNVKRTLIDERDYYLTNKILNASGNRVVAVVGSGHLAGIKKNIEKFDEKGKEEHENLMKNITRIPKGRNLGKIFAYSILLLIAGMFIYGFYVGGMETFTNMAWTWFLYHSVFAAIGAVLAFAHPLTILATFIFSPFTAIHPGIGIGTVSALIEAKVRPPKVIDFENLQRMRKWKDMWKNQVIRIIFIFFFTSTGGSIATFVSMGFMFPMLW